MIQLIRSSCLVAYICSNFDGYFSFSLCDQLAIIPCPLSRGSARNFPTGGLTLPTRGLKYGFQGTINAKNLRKSHVSPSDGGLACSDGGLYAP